MIKRAEFVTDLFLFNIMNSMFLPKKKKLNNLLNVKDISFYSDLVCTEDLTFDNIGHLLKVTKALLMARLKR